jgi:acyl carrier protein
MPSEAAIRDWCVAQLAMSLDRPAVEIDPEASFPQLGLDSAASTWFVVALEEWLGLELDPELVFAQTSIAALARHLAEEPT